MLKANEAPTSYKGLLDPKWKGKVSIDTSPQYHTSREGQNVLAKFGHIGVRPDADVQHKRLKELVTGPALDRLSLITVEDVKYVDQAGELIKKYIEPRLRKN